MPNVIRIPQTPPRKNRLTLEDRRQAVLWIKGSAGIWCTIAICEDPFQDDEIGDWISVYRLHERWASWGAARRAETILLWKSDYGQDVGTFPDMVSALNAIFACRLRASEPRESLWPSRLSL